MDSKTNTGWVVAGVLAVAVVLLAGIMWYQWEAKQNKLDNVLTEGYEEIATVRAEVQIQCQGPARNDAECERALNELAEILRDFGEDLSETEPAGSGAPN